MELYPLNFKPIYKEKIWGGNKLKTNFNRDLPNNSIGESWEIAAHSDDISTIKNGPLRGQRLTTIIEKNPKKMMGDNKINNFPLLVKLLDASKNLSVQVHPDDQYALKKEGEAGKTEMWYILDAEPEAKLIYGLKPGTTKNDIAISTRNGKLEKYLNEVSVNTGDILFIPPGTIHATGEGILLAEIQQNSDTTYRVYDWNRKGKNGKPRPLHIDQALKVINFNNKPVTAKSKALTCKYRDYNRRFLAACPYFITEKIEIKNEFNIKTDKNKFNILLPLSGEGILYHQQKKYSMKAGETLFIPAALKEIKIEGNINLLRIYIPENKHTVLNKLRNLGFQNRDINNLAGLKNWT